MTRGLRVDLSIYNKKVRIFNEFTNITSQSKEKDHAYERLRQNTILLV